MRETLVDGLFVAVIGILVAFAANAISPRGLSLTRNFFPANPSIPLANAGTNIAGHAAGTNVVNAAELLAASLRSKGLSLADSNQVFKLFQDPRYEQNLVAFIDARHDEDYQAGHIPGAYQLDYYYKEKYLPPLLDVVRIAEQIVVYCNGGTCDDSELTATLLADIVPRERLFVYGGGMTEWVTNGWPVELGERKSGRLREVKK